MKSNSASIYILSIALIGSITGLGFLQIQKLSLQRDLLQLQASAKLDSADHTATYTQSLEAISAELEASLALQQNRIGELTDELQLRNQRANPDFELLKQRALNTLEREKFAWESANPHLVRLQSGLGQAVNQGASITNTASLLVPILNVLGVDSALQQQIVAAIAAKDNHNREIFSQYRSNGINSIDLSGSIDVRSDSDILSELLTAEQLTEFLELREKQQKDLMRNVYASQIDRQSGQLSYATRDLLIEGYTAMNELQPIDFSNRVRSNPNDMKQIKLLQLRDWMTEQVSEIEMFGVDVFIESQLVANERVRATVTAQQNQ